MIYFKHWQPEYRAFFEALNREWIERLFIIEQHDEVVFANPQKEIIDHGGQIFFVIDDDNILDCCALINHGNGEYEISKLAVAGSAQGKGIGSKLLDYVISYAKNINAKILIIESNTALLPAIHLYHKFGFAPVADFLPSYERVNVKFSKSL